jgi:polyphosphate kinase
MPSEPADPGRPTRRGCGPYFNRELSWLAFNERVLDEARDPSVPFLERLKFLAIFGSNLDEFMMIRYAGLKEQQAAGVTRPSFDGLTASSSSRRSRRTSTRWWRSTGGCCARRCCPPWRSAAS